MHAALLLVDLQHDYLHHPQLAPSAPAIVANAGQLLRCFRERRLSVVHAHTVVRPDGTNRMPHWQLRDHWACVEGAAGALAPPEVAPVDGERIFAKTFYSAFDGKGDLAATLHDRAVDTLMVAGVHTHGCVRASVLDAYAAGFNVYVAEDAVGSYDPLHAAVTRAYLHERACRFVETAQILHQLSGGPTRGKPEADAPGMPAACVDGRWLPAGNRRTVARYSPADASRPLARIPISDANDVDKACQAARRQQAAWAAVPAGARVEVLEAWAAVLDHHRPQMLTLLAEEIGKPHAEASGELTYALALLRAAARTAAEDRPEHAGEGVQVRRHPLGTVGVVTPWNNPVALATGKIAPALAWGNSVVWKPAIEAPRLAMLVMETLLQAGAPTGSVNMVFGEAATAQAIVRHPCVNAVSFTGSSSAGREVSVACAMHNKPLQGEFGGNNAAIVTSACDAEATAAELAHSAFAFAGQRCTAIRRVILDEGVSHRFTAALLAAVDALPLGPADQAATRIGPLISRDHQRRVAAVVQDAIEQGARVLCGGRVPAGLERGCWYEPTVLAGISPETPVFQQETFGPVLTLSESRDVEHAIRLANGVEHGLVACIHCDDATVTEPLLRSIEAGIVRVNAGSAPIDAHAPFSGWKASSVGPPEHGRWDRAFYTRVQAIYRGG